MILKDSVLERIAGVYSTWPSCDSTLCLVILSLRYSVLGVLRVLEQSGTLSRLCASSG